MLEEALRMREIDKSLTEEVLITFAESAVIDVSEVMERIGKMHSIKDILVAINSLKADLLCLVKQEALLRNEEYCLLSKKLYN